MIWSYVDNLLPLSIVIEEWNLRKMETITDKNDRKLCYIDRVCYIFYLLSNYLYPM